MKVKKKEKSCGCIVIENNKVLLIQHIKRGHWGFPKGHVEKNENEMQTAIREVKEETNIDVEIDENKRYEEHYNTGKKGYKEVVYFLAKKVGGEIKAQEKEIRNVEWVDISEAPNRITFPTSQELMKKVINDEKLLK